MVKAPSSGLQAHLRRRLQEMSGHRFVKIEESGDLTLVGRAQDPWTEDEISDAFRRVRSLASDPARGDKITPMGVEEASVALTAENLHTFHHLEREKTGASEFVDENNRFWDVKSPFSPPPEKIGWYYSPHHQLEQVRDDLAKGDRVLLNLSRLRPEHRDQTLDLFREQLTQNERGQLLVLTDAPIQR